MIKLLYYCMPLVMGCSYGYYYGLFLVNQGKALSFSFLIPLMRLCSLFVIAFLLLHYGLITFILFFVSFIGMMWYSIINFR
ncbi:hypothetical protein H0X06_06635 [Candidatus Dependentiae bacterium]|nr:hypothetical protein [Candidatus Dependentiae bacterium]